MKKDSTFTLCVFLHHFVASVMEAVAFNEASARFAAGDASGALAALQSDRGLFSRLIECKFLEELGDLESAESKYMEIFQVWESPCPLGLLHYLAFLHRTRSVTDSLSFFDDMCIAESEHVTADIFPAVALGIAWGGAEDVQVRFERTMGIFSKCVSNRPEEYSAIIADFLAINANFLKLAEFELSKSISFAKNVKKNCILWRKWEQILQTFNADCRTIASMSNLEQFEKKKNRPTFYIDEELSAQEDVCFPYLVNPVGYHDTCLVGESLMNKFKLLGQPNLNPKSSILETVLGLEKIGQLTNETLDLRDGGDGPTNHVYRPDVSCMIKYDPHEFLEKPSHAIPECLANLCNLLPQKPLKHANASYMAEQCIRLMLSVTMPSRLITEEAYTNVDKRTRASKIIKIVQPIKKIDEEKIVKKEETTEYYQA